MSSSKGVPKGGRAEGDRGLGGKMHQSSPEPTPLLEMRSPCVLGVYNLSAFSTVPLHFANH